jgi:hypothetical protein
MPGPTRLLALGLAAALAVAPLVACSGDEEAAAPDDATTSTEAGPAAPGADDGGQQEEPDPEPIEEFDGSFADFYEVPDPLGDGPSGELLRFQRTEEQPVTAQRSTASSTGPSRWLATRSW